MIGQVSIPTRACRTAPTGDRRRGRSLEKTIHASARNGARYVTAKCEACGHEASVNVDALPESMHVPDAGRYLRCSRCNAKRVSARPAWHAAKRQGVPDLRAERLGPPSEQPGRTPERGKAARAHPCEHGRLHPAVRGLRADLAKHPLTEGVMSRGQALRGFKAAMDAALGRAQRHLVRGLTLGAVRG